VTTNPNNNEEDYDLIVIGGGAAGYFTAIQTAEASYGAAKILILEKSNNTLNKVKISGGGRCNVTHHCFEPKLLTQHYPRGEKMLIGPFHHFQPQNMIDWLEERGVTLKTEADGRMFPVTDSSQTIIDCLEDAILEHGIEVRRSSEVASIEPSNKHAIHLTTGETFYTKHIMIATGGTRLASSSILPKSLGHVLTPPVPSLFTFNIKDQRLEGISGLSVKHVEATVSSRKLESSGPILVTHWGLSGPAILKLSAWGARELSEIGYKCELKINWSTDQTFDEALAHQRENYGKRSVIKRSPIESIPRRLWEKLCISVNISPDTTWAQLNKTQIAALHSEVHECQFSTTGKSINKEEFVTCGGVQLSELNGKTFESKRHEGIHFAGEVLDIDGVTGGFNFQSAWTTSYLASQAIAQAILADT